jgi:hypothetical protein
MVTLDGIVFNPKYDYGGVCVGFLNPINYSHD